jgi:hypothetical protein
MAESKGLDIRRLDFAKNVGKILLLPPTPPVTCDRRAQVFYQHSWKIKWFGFWG